MNRRASGKNRQPIRGRAKQIHERSRPAFAANRHRHAKNSGRRGNLHRVADEIKTRGVPPRRKNSEQRKKQNLPQRKNNH
jgi:hypothetical protein